MVRRCLTVAAAALVLLVAPASADPGDQWKTWWEKRAECDEKLSEAKSRRDFRQKAAECNRELAKLDGEQRRKAIKAWRETEKRWRERHPDDDGGYHDWDD